MMIGAFECLHAVWFILVATEMHERGSSVNVLELIRDNHYVDVGKSIGFMYEVIETALWSSPLHLRQNPPSYHSFARIHTI